ncbi:MAG: TetR/AcrR family transcriptional regulator [SAR324 cluster bacterium]|nr:TetR/AcrR family transcriptional regulator [SAR324 cluster bacterium]
MARKQEFEREDVIDSAMTLFWIQGCQATTPMQLITEMKLSKSSLYNTFQSKKKLYLECLQTFIDQRVSVYRKIFEGNDFPVALDLMFKRHLDALAIKNRRGCFIVNSAIELSPHDTEVEALVRQGFQRIENVISKGLVKAQEQGLVSKNHQAEALAKFFLSSSNGLSVMSKSNPERESLEKIVKIILSVL